MATAQDSFHEAAEAISTAFVEAYNTGDTSLIDDVVTDDFVCHHVAGGQELHGADGYKPRIEELRSAFPDLHMTQDTLIVDGEMGACHYNWTGTHGGEFMGIPATKKQIDTNSLTMMRMDGDKMAEMWVYGDSRGLMEQLGVEM